MLKEILQLSLEKKASDIILSANAKPVLKLHWEIRYLEECFDDLDICGFRFKSFTIDGRKGVIRFLENRYPKIPIHQIDERFTSKIAKQSILASGVKKKGRQNKALVDEVSATIILRN